MPFLKGKVISHIGQKSEFEAVISQIYIEDVYEHLNFVMIWVYFMTGVRVNEGCALQWNDVDFDKQRLRVHHMLIVKNKKEWTRNSYTKTNDGKRMISLDKDTIDVLKKWREAQKKDWTRTRERFYLFIRWLTYAEVYNLKDY